MRWFNLSTAEVECYERASTFFLPGPVVYRYGAGGAVIGLTLN